MRDARLARQVSSEVESLESRLLLSTATFSGPGVYPVRPFTKIITLADFNGDGKPDIAGAVSQGGGAVVTLLNNGNGTFSQPFYFAAGIPRSIASADFNHDGKIDLAVAGGTESNTANVQIFFGNGDGTFVTPPTRYPLPGGGQAIMATDLNGDGFADLLIATASRIAVLMNNGNGTFARPIFYNTGGDNPKDLAIADFNNDGVPDIAISGGRNQRVAILLGNKSAPGTFGPPIFLPASSNPQQLAVADFNHDGNEDLAVVSSQFQGSTVNVLLGNGNGTFRPPLRYTTQANFSDAIVSGDFTGTRLGDLVVGSFTGNLKLFAGNGDGTFAPPQTIPDVIY
ncbi:MAG TPA: VCBS repeat-containing protein, partial [Tepidisphaeraceae bacterium]|nr:VCBS repeat-containing protein [Tepidisphaeraceae bacterium]